MKLYLRGNGISISLKEVFQKLPVPSKRQTLWGGLMTIQSYNPWSATLGPQDVGYRTMDECSIIRHWTLIILRCKTKLM